MKKLLSSLLIALMLLSLTGEALAQNVTVNGTVVSTQTEIVSASAGGTVQEVLAAVGDAVSAGDTLVTLETSKIYALQDGVVRLFGEVGDEAAAIAERYGAVAYIEPALLYSISTSTKNAYTLEENKIIHPGETVYLRAVENNQHVGTGKVTSVTASGYTVDVLTGNLQSEETVNIYRSADYASASRIGRGSVALNAPIAYTGAGLIAAFAVTDGAQVKKGDVLFETVDGTYASMKSDLTKISAPADGIVSSISLLKGSALSSGGTVAEIYLNDGMRIEASVSESDLQFFQEGNAVRIEFNYLEDGEFSISGIVEKISRIGVKDSGSDSEEAWFSVLIRPESTESLSYGLHAVVTTVDSDEAKHETPLNAVENDAGAAAEEAEEEE